MRISHLLTVVAIFFAVSNAIAQPSCVSNTDCNDDNPCTIDRCSNGRCINRIDAFGETPSDPLCYGWGSQCHAILGIDPATLQDGEAFIGRLGNGSIKYSDTDPYEDKLEDCIEKAIRSSCLVDKNRDDTGIIAYHPSLLPDGSQDDGWFSVVFNDTSGCR